MRRANCQIFSNSQSLTVILSVGRFEESAVNARHKTTVLSYHLLNTNFVISLSQTSS